MHEPVDSNTDDNSDLRIGPRLLRRVRHELMLEIGFVAICFALAIGLEGKGNNLLVLALLVASFVLSIAWMPFFVLVTRPADIQQ